MTTVIWSTESVDTSAMLLAQTLDDVIFTKTKLGDDKEDLGEDALEALEAITDEQNQVIFYGIVRLPEWFENDWADMDRMFNYPGKARALLRRNNVIATLLNEGVQGLQYTQIREDGPTFTRLRDALGRKFDLVIKTGMTVTHTISNAADFNEARNNVHFACKHVNPAKKIRAFMGVPDITNNGVIGITVSEKRQLTFQESLVYGSSIDVRQHIDELFSNGILSEDMGQGQVAWTEKTRMSAENIDEDTLTKLQTIANILHNAYKVDFFAIDAVVTEEGELYVTNCTSSPSLQDDTVLDFVSRYHKDLLMHGRKMSKDRLLKIIQELSEEQATAAARLLKKEGMLEARV